MTEMDETELKEGKKQLEGVVILCWVMAIITGLAVFSGLFWSPIGIIRSFMDYQFTINDFTEIIRNITSFPFRMIYSLIGPAMYIAELIGIQKRKSFAVPLGRAVLVITMLIFPIGTIIGAILWKRFNNPDSKKYLNYGV